MKIHKKHELCSGKNERRKNTKSINSIAKQKQKAYWKNRKTSRKNLNLGVCHQKSHARCSTSSSFRNHFHWNLTNPIMPFCQNKKYHEMNQFHILYYCVCLKIPWQFSIDMSNFRALFVRLVWSFMLKKKRRIKIEQNILDPNNKMHFAST